MKQSYKRRGRRVVVDTSAVISGISGFKSPFVAGKNDSADMLHEWAESGNFVWLVTPAIVDEYKEVAKRLRVRANVVGRFVNLLKEEAGVPFQAMGVTAYIENGCTIENA